MSAGSRTRNFLPAPAPNPFTSSTCAHRFGMRSALLMLTSQQAKSHSAASCSSPEPWQWAQEITCLPKTTTTYKKEVQQCQRPAVPLLKSSEGLPTGSSPLEHGAKARRCSPEALDKVSCSYLQLLRKARNIGRAAVVHWLTWAL